MADSRLVIAAHSRDVRVVAREPRTARDLLAAIKRNAANGIVCTYVALVGKPNLNVR